jgi:hypothetical protein
MTPISDPPSNIGMCLMNIQIQQHCGPDGGRWSLGSGGEPEQAQWCDTVDLAAKQ